MILRYKKIKAFTLTEMMVVIVISALVAGLAFSVLAIVQHNMQKISQNYEYKTQIQSLETALTIDFNKFPNADWDASENILTVSSPIGRRNYRFYSDSIVTDVKTYPLRIKHSTVYFEGKKVHSGTIDAIKISLHKTREEHNVFIFKYNDPTVHF